MMPHKIILASASPRRQALLRDAGLPFQVRLLPVEEHFPEDMPALEVAEYLAVKKGIAHQEHMQPDEIVITADTTVVVDDLVLNKPEDEAEALQMLQRISGRGHQVVTGVCLSFPDRREHFSDITDVYFRPLDKSEMTYYITHYEPFDKAGAYAIQEWIGMVGIERIEGSYFNVVGLPVSKLLTTLRKMAIVPVNPL
jgi:septum formation protein